MRRLRWGAAAIAWTGAALMAAFVFAHAVHWDHSSLLILLEAVTPIVLLPAWGVLAAAVAGRWRLLAVVAVALIAAQIILTYPEFAARRPVTAVARSAPQLVVFDGNVFDHNHRTREYGREIRDARADVVVLEEADPAFVAALKSDGAVAAYPYSTFISVEGPQALAVWSRYPLSDTTVRYVDWDPALLETTVATPVRPQRLFAVHTLAPLGRDVGMWRRALQLVADTVRVTPGPLLVVGDFNATWGNRAFRALTDDHLADAAAALGDPLAMTWPRDRAWIPPLARIDHLLTRGAIAPTRIRLGRGRGSDHRPVIASFALL